MAKKLFKYSELRTSMRYTIESATGVELDGDDINEAVDNFIEDLGISDYVQFDPKEKVEESYDEELRFDD